MCYCSSNFSFDSTIELLVIDFWWFFRLMGFGKYPGGIKGRGISAGAKSTANDTTYHLWFLKPLFFPNYVQKTAQNYAQSTTRADLPRKINKILQKSHITLLRFHDNRNSQDKINYCHSVQQLLPLEQEIYILYIMYKLYYMEFPIFFELQSFYVGKVNPHTPDLFTPARARCAENCGSALTHRLFDKKGTFFYIKWCY